MADQGHRWVLSGGIGSGKTAVRHLLAAAGVDTVDADALGHEVLEPAGPAFQQVASAWPEVVVEGRIDRAVLGGIVFNDPGQLKKLEEMTHPHIFGSIKARIQDFDARVVVEIPLLHHTLGEEWRRIVVDSSDEARLARSVARGMSREDVEARMRSQPAREQWLAHADLVVPNHGSLEELRRTVSAVISVL